MKIIKQEVSGNDTRSWFLCDEMDFDVLI